MSLQLIVNRKTGEVGVQARADWQTGRGQTRYFSVKRHGFDASVRQALKADRELNKGRK